MGYQENWTFYLVLCLFVLSLRTHPLSDFEKHLFFQSKKTIQVKWHNSARSNSRVWLLTEIFRFSFTIYCSIKITFTNTFINSLFINIFTQNLVFFQQIWNLNQKKQKFGFRLAFQTDFYFKKNYIKIKLDKYQIVTLVYMN